METPEIREMSEEDLGQVAQLEAEIFSSPWSAESFLGEISNTGNLYLTAWMQGELAGYCGFIRILNEGDITNVAVASKWRRRGIAGQMLRELIFRGEERGVCDFTLEVREGNMPARNLYRNLGFEEEGIRKNFYEKPTENAVIMWKRGTVQTGSEQ